MYRLYTPLKERAHADRPREGLHLDVQLGLQLVEQLEGVLPSRSSLFTKMMTGVLRMRQTCISFSVCSSTPLTQSTTRMTLSTAVSVR